MTLRKGQKTTYKSGLGLLFSAYVLVVHRDGTYTVRLYFPLGDDGVERAGFMGDKFRVGKPNLPELWT